MMQIFMGIAYVFSIQLPDVLMSHKCSSELNWQVFTQAQKNKWIIHTHLKYVHNIPTKLHIIQFATDFEEKQYHMQVLSLTWAGTEQLMKI